MRKAYTEYEDEIITKYSLKMACKILADTRSRGSVINRRHRLINSGVIMKNFSGLITNLHEVKPHPYIAVGLESITKDRNATISRICDYFGLSFKDVTSGSRRELISNAKRWVSYYLYNECKMSYFDTAKTLKLDNHSSVLYHVKTVNNRLSINDVETLDIKKDLDKLLGIKK